MEWIELTIRTASEGIELLCAELTEAGFDSYMIDDCQEFNQFLDSARDYWDYVDEDLTRKMEGLSQVRLYLEEEGDIARLRELLRQLPVTYPACSFGPLTISLSKVPDEDWENSWKKNYRPLVVGEKLLIVPSWMTPEGEAGRLPVLLDMGLTFGTGEHDSTRMCLEALEGLIKGGEKVADLGSGSGILSIASLRLGAGRAVGVDIDPAAEHISRENALLNGFGPDRFSSCTGDVVAQPEVLRSLGRDFDLVCANIVAPVIIRLLPVVPGLLGQNGIFLCSGILRVYEEDVKKAIRDAGLRVILEKHTEEWCCLGAQK